MNHCACITADGKRGSVGNTVIGTDELYGEIMALPEVDESDVDMYTEIQFTLECIYMPSFDDALYNSDNQSDTNTSVDTTEETTDDL